jgi:signal transduction histidine kinase
MIFDPYFTIKAAGKKTGQGLAIAPNIIVHKHGRKIFFETKPENGPPFASAFIGLKPAKKGILFCR